MNKRLLWLAMLGCAVCTPALAGDIKLRGFGSFTGGMVLDDNETLYDYDDNVDFRKGSLIALQADAKLDKKMSATMQVLSRGANDFDSKVEWAYASYNITPSKKVSIGRMKLPLYRFSDFLDVRYSYNWAKAPRTVYGFDFPGHDGVSFLSKDHFFGVDSTFQVVAGSYEGIAGKYQSSFKNIHGFAWMLNKDWFTFRVNKMNTEKTTVEVPQLAHVLKLFGPQDPKILENVPPAFWPPNLTEHIRVKDDKGSFQGIGISIDYNNFILETEAINYLVEDSLVDETNAFYSMLAYRFGRFTPSYTYSNIETKANTKLLGMVPAFMDVTPIETPMGNLTASQILRGAMAIGVEDTQLQELGVRYDITNNAAFKLTYTEEKKQNKDAVGLIRMSVDLVF